MIVSDARALLWLAIRDNYDRVYAGFSAAYSCLLTLLTLRMPIYTVI